MKLQSSFDLPRIRTNISMHAKRCQTAFPADSQPVKRVWVHLFTWKQKYPAGLCFKRHISVQGHGSSQTLTLGQRRIRVPDSDTIWFSRWCQCDDLHVSVRCSNLNKLLLGTLWVCLVFLKCRLTHQRWNKTSHKCCRTKICSSPLCFDRSNKVTGRKGPRRTSAGWSNNWVLEIASTLGCCVHKNTTTLLMLQGNPARIFYLLLIFVAKIIHLDKKFRRIKKYILLGQ